jgi:hypothetical protein
VACACSGGKVFIVTTKDGDKITKSTEIEAKSLARRSGGSYVARAK